MPLERSFNVQAPKPVSQLEDTADVIAYLQRLEERLDRQARDLYAGHTIKDLRDVNGVDYEGGGIFYGDGSAIQFAPMVGAWYLCENGRLRLRQTNVDATGSGTSQGTASALTAGFNHVINITATDRAVILPDASEGIQVMVYNPSGFQLLVFPYTDEYINGGSPNASVTVPATSTVWFNAHTDEEWITLG